MVWALPFSLAATPGIDFSFSSSGYLDVSVHRVPPAWLCIRHAVAEVSSAGFPHSDTCGSPDICSSPQLFAAYHVFLRLLVPRHPPCALISLTFPAFWQFLVYSVIPLLGLLFFFLCIQLPVCLGCLVWKFGILFPTFLFSVCSFQGTIPAVP